VASQTDPPFDLGGIIPSGITLCATTMQPERRLSPAQTKAFNDAVEFVRRWEARGGKDGTTHG